MNLCIICNHQGQPLLELSDSYLKAEQTISKATAAKDSQVLEASFRLVVAHILLITGLGIGLRTCEVNNVSQQSNPYTACLGVPLVWTFHRIFRMFAAQERNTCWWRPA